MCKSCSHSAKRRILCVRVSEYAFESVRACACGFKDNQEPVHESHIAPSLSLVCFHAYLLIGQNAFVVGSVSAHQLLLHKIDLYLRMRALSFNLLEPIACV